MATRVSKRLVVDASIVRSAGGEDAIFPISKCCRDFLKAVLEICHQLVLTPEIREEWKRHRSNFARKWLVSMTARKKVHHFTNVRNEVLRSRLEDVAASIIQESQYKAVWKDLLLIEAAIAADRIVISLDEQVRHLFAVCAQRVIELKTITWVNPGRDEEAASVWLESGARAERLRLLGFWSEKK